MARSHLGRIRRVETLRMSKSELNYWLGILVSSSAEEILSREGFPREGPQDN